MTLPAIPEHLDEFVYDLKLRRKGDQCISDQLWEIHQVKASRMAVASCFARVKKEKLANLFALTDGASGLDGGGHTLDRLFRESQAFALEAVEGHQLNAGLRAIDQQLRILKIHYAQLHAEEAAEKKAGRFIDHANTLQRPDEPEGHQGVSAIWNGVEDHPAEQSSETPVPQDSPQQNQATAVVMSNRARPSPSEGEGSGAATHHDLGAPLAAPRVRDPRVREPQARVPAPTTATPERNKPCPCGSHRKYKKCCFLHPRTDQSSP